MVQRIFKFWLWNNYIFKMCKNGRNFRKSLKILHEFTENVSDNIYI
jgi:cytochrome P450 family 4 subfamily V